LCPPSVLDWASANLFCVFLESGAWQMVGGTGGWLWLLCVLCRGAEKAWRGAMEVAAC